MSQYGPPPGPIAGPGDSAQQAAVLSYAAAALGLLAFIWGFLDWFGGAGVSVSGYSAVGGPAGAVVGLALVAGLLAAVAAFEKKDVGLTPGAVAVAGLLVAFGALVGHGDAGGASDVKIGVILAFITAILQTAALILAWLLATKRMAALGGGSPSGSTTQGFPGPQGFSGPQFVPPPGSGYGPPPQQPGSDDGSRTQVLPRFAPDQNFAPDERPADRPGASAPDPAVVLPTWTDACRPR